MKSSSRNHPILKWTAATLIGLVAILALELALIDWNALRSGRV